MGSSAARLRAASASSQRTAASTTTAPTPRSRVSSDIVIAEAMLPLLNVQQPTVALQSRQPSHPPSPMHNIAPSTVEAPLPLQTHVSDIRRTPKRPREESKQDAADQSPLQANRLSSRLRTWTDRALDRISDRERPGSTPDCSSYSDTGDVDPDPRVYADWTSKQLRKKCSYLKLRGLKNVKKHVMVDALNRYYRTQILLNQHLEGTANPTSFSWMGNNGGRGSGGNRSQASSSSGSNINPRSRTLLRRGGGREGLWPRSSSFVRQLVPSHRAATPNGFLSPNNLAAVGRQGQPLVIGSVNGNDESDKPVMLSDITRLIDVMLSPSFVPRLEHELSRWQFWVDVRDSYVAVLEQQEVTANSSGSPSSSEPLPHRLQQSPRRRTPLWNAMQLWEIWQKLTLAYTRTCFHFTCSGAQEGGFIKFCDGRLDVYYLHQRLHEHPELLYFVKSSDYLSSSIDDSDDNSEPRAPIPTQQQQYTNNSATSESVAPRSSSSDMSSLTTVTAVNAGAGASGPRASSNFSNSTSGGGQPSSGNVSSGSDPNASTSDETDEATDDQMNTVYNEACAQQRYLALLLANFDRATERLHESHVAMLELRDSGNGSLPPPPKLVVSELEADVVMLTSLKAQLRERLVQTLGA